MLKEYGKWVGGIGLLTMLCLLALFMVAPLSTPPVVHAQQGAAWPNPPYFPVNINFSSASNQTLVAAPAAGSVCVYSLSMTNSGASAVTASVYLDGGTTAVASAYLVAGGGNAFWPLIYNNPKSPWFLTNPTTGFVVKTSGAVQINGSVYAATCP